MDAKSFVSNKHQAALEELTNLEAEYQKKRTEIQARIDIVKSWLSELESGQPAVADLVKDDSPSSMQDYSKRPSDTWVSARDLGARVRAEGSSV